ncbi:MAG: GWxTD domain-containing protein, partial [Terriglobia bacterium]
MNRRCRRTLVIALTTGLLWLPAAAAPDNQDKKGQRPLSEGLPQRELSKKEQERREKALRKELESHFKKWLAEDVFYIITPEEKSAFKDLSTEEEREQFIEQFWLRRDPTPDTIENEFKEEHYRRIAYANERLRGWRSDRGMIYIIHGPPDEIEQMPEGGFYNRLAEEGGGGTAVFPFERWRYRYIEGVGDDIILEFVDRCMCGDYQLTMDPSEKDALTLSLGHGLTLMEQLGLAKKVDRFTRGDATRMGESFSKTVRSQEFERLRIHATVQRPPPVKFKDLEALVTTRISFKLLPFEMRADFLRVTSTSVLVPITIGIKNKDVTFQLRSGLHRSVVNIFGRITTLTGRIVQTFEDVIQ